MNCRHVSQSLSAFLDDELGGTQMLAVRHHVSECRACQRELAALRALQGHMKALPNVAPATPSHEAMMAKVKARQPRIREKLHAVGMLTVSSVAAAVLAVALFSRLYPQTPVAGNGQPAPFSANSDLPYVAGADPFGNHVPLQPVHLENR